MFGIGRCEDAKSSIFWAQKRDNFCQTPCVYLKNNDKDNNDENKLTIITRKPCYHKETARCSMFSYAQRLFDCYLLQVTKAQGSQSLTKSRLKMKLKIINNNTKKHVFCIMTLQGHPRSLILAPIKSTYMTSYWSSIVTLVLS